MRGSLPLSLLIGLLTACTGGDGADGVDGADGTDGTNGTNGTNGADGVDGADGAAGTPCTVVDNVDGTYTLTCGTDVVTVTDPAYVPAGYMAADPIAGGAAYAKWWVTQAGGTGTLASAGVTVGAEFVRCKTCHAWDGLGNAASYANRTGRSTGAASRPDVSTFDLTRTIESTTPLELYSLIKGVGARPLNAAENGHPDYSAALTDVQIWNLVKFMREGWIYPDDLYYVAVDGPPVYTSSLGTVVAPTLTFYGIGVDGDATAGTTAYTAKCASCHGADGTQLNMAGASVGELVRTKPYEMWHKFKFGAFSDTSGVAMATGLVTDTTEMQDLYRALTNTVAYPDL